MGSDESHLNVSVGSDGQSHKTASTNHNLFEEVLPLTSLTPQLPLGQTGSQSMALIYYNRTVAVTLEDGVECRRQRVKVGYSAECPQNMKWLQIFAIVYHRSDSDNCLCLCLSVCLSLF